MSAAAVVSFIVMVIVILALGWLYFSRKGQSAVDAVLDKAEEYGGSADASIDRIEDDLKSTLNEVVRK